MELKDKVVVITGATRGIGRAIARACAQQGAREVISFRKESAVKETCETFQKENFKVSGIKADVAINAAHINQNSFLLLNKIDQKDKK